MSPHTADIALNGHNLERRQIDYRLLHHGDGLTGLQAHYRQVGQLISQDIHTFIVAAVGHSTILGVLILI